MFWEEDMLHYLALHACIYILLNFHHLIVRPLGGSSAMSYRHSFILMGVAGT